MEELVVEEGNPELKLRVFVTAAAARVSSTDSRSTRWSTTTTPRMKKNGVTLLIDAMSLQYLVGAEIDYKEDLQGAQFVIKNPNATTTCGCGFNTGRSDHTKTQRAAMTLKTIHYHNGSSLSYADTGDPHGFPILIQHGLIASIHDSQLFERLTTPAGA